MKSNSLNILLAASLGASALTGCGIYQKYDPAKAESQLVREYARALAETPDSLALGNISWRDIFTDPILADLISRALAANSNLENAKLNVDIAQAQLRGARLSYLPSLSFAPNGSGTKYGSHDFNWTYQLPLSAAWEVDVFGKTLNAKRSAEVGVMQAEALRQATRSQLIAGVAQCYYTIASLSEQLKLMQETAVIWKESIQVMRNFKEAGRLREDAVVQSEAQYYGIEASITDIKSALHEANNAMSLLLNTTPQRWTVTPGALSATTETKLTDIPMSQLAVRPDVRAAEMSLAAAFYSTASARAAFYPSLNITAGGGFTNLLGVVTNPGDWFAQLAGQLSAPIFARGQNIARLEAAKARQAQALNSFEYTLLGAAADVSNALTAMEQTTEKLGWLKLQVADLEKGVDITTELLKLDGSTTYLEVLTAQRNLLSTRTALLTTALSYQRARINLYQNLGGGR